MKLVNNTEMSPKTLVPSPKPRRGHTTSSALLPKVIEVTNDKEQLLPTPLARAYANTKLTAHISKSKPASSTNESLILV